MSNLMTYGTATTPESVSNFVKHVFNTNLINMQKGKKRQPICIWGTHGIGKTELVAQIAKENDWDFVDIAPAQFEEVGDLIGMPKIVDGETVFCAPSWVPKDTGKPVVLLLDDYNRADDRILRATMQLLQNHGMVSWDLPEKCIIVLTANPDGGDYSVTPMDDAMLTRMMHITMEFDVKEWANWAIKNGIDERGVNFALTYPETITGNRTTPRSLVHFFNSIQNIKDLSAELGLVQMLADSCLDKVTVGSFTSFVQNQLTRLMSPEDIITSENYDVVKKHLNSVTKRNGNLNVGVVATLSTRMVHYLANRSKMLSDNEIKNLKSFCLWDEMPNDIRLSLLQDIITISGNNAQDILEDERIGNMLLDRMS